jgi:hypothetical protein
MNFRAGDLVTFSRRDYDTDAHDGLGDETFREVVGVVLTSEEDQAVEFLPRYQAAVGLQAVRVLSEGRVFTVSMRHLKPLGRRAG